MHIVIVDDDRNMLKALLRAIRLLRKRQHTCKGFSSGDDALKYFKAHKDEVDAAIIDVVLPGGCTGIDLANEILDIVRGKLPILFCTGLSDRYNAELLRNVGGALVLVKEDLPEGLEIKLRELERWHESIKNMRKMEKGVFWVEG